MLEVPGDFATLTLIEAPEDQNALFYRYQGGKGSLILNQPTTVPWGVFNHLCGSPFYKGKDRALVYEQLCRRAGVLPGMKLPYTITAQDSDGDAIASILDDPEGVDAPTTNFGETLDPTAIRQTLITMQRRVSDLERQLAQTEAQMASDPEKSDLPSPARKARAAKAKPTTTRAAESPVPTIEREGSADPSGGIIPDDMPTQLPVS